MDLPQWISLFENLSLPGVMALVLWRFGKWADPLITKVVEAFAAFLVTLGKEMVAQTIRLDRHSDFLKEIVPRVREMHAVIVETAQTGNGQDEETSRVDRLTARRGLRTEPIP